LSVLTYNVRGLPWPIALGRDEALREIGRELAGLRRQGRQPDVVLIQEGFTHDVAVLVRESGYRYWARGPGRRESTPFAGAILGARDVLRGEGVGKVFGAGLHVLSDAPILDVRHAAFNNCAGLDCLANKGAMLVRVAPDGLPTPIDIVNTHMNARKASRAPRSRTLPAHNGQVRELAAFISTHRAPGAPLVVGGDFNVRNSPQRYYFDALERPYTVVSEYCATVQSGCGPDAPDPASEPWLSSQDLQAFRDGEVQVKPVRAEQIFAAASGRALSDHPGYLVRYRLSWAGALDAAYRPAPDVAVRPHKLGLRVSWTP
ncbi:MAG: endonuclease/exonuclease/phosphatase family protein, partial [Phenylobacterium sp.]|nr:endonuclease/exonuclease/phosphatase family protein [Phenylobacterium sp.]